MTTRVASGTGLRISRIERISDLESMSDEWRHLETRCPDLKVFSTWEWCITVARHFQNEEPLWVFAVRDGEHLVGLAPLARLPGDGPRIVRHIGTGLGPYSVADYQDLLLSEGYEQAVVEALCDKLHELADGWDVLHLQEIPLSSRTPALLVASARTRGWRCIEKPGSDVHLLMLPESWQVYRSSLSHRTRKQFERRHRKLVRECNAEFIRVEDEGQLQDAMNALYALHTRRWSAAGKPGIFRTEQRRNFHQEVARRFHQRGALNLVLVKANGQVIGASYAFIWGGTNYLYAGGYLPEREWHPYALGTSTDVNEIRTSIGLGLRCVDFLRGDPHYKDRYHTETRYNRQLLVFRDRRAQFRYQVSELARRATGRLKSTLRLRR
jgi:CelD/BcsL family acetyltransferase involved in cellulose biosynthesis